MKSAIKCLFILITTMLIGSIAMAGDDPSIQGDERAGVTKAMEELIEQNTLDGKFVIYDPVAGELKKLDFDNLHSGIVKKGGFYVSCADFNDEQGNAYDLDFLVARSGEGYKGLEAVVHSINKEKRPYHLES